jgi:phosphoethanolamine N-methyltransferase
MNINETAELYHDQMIGMLERVWGDGWLSPGGPAEVARLLEGMDLKGKSILDIGCGAGGIDVLLVGTHGAGYVTGISLKTRCWPMRASGPEGGHTGQIGVLKVVRTAAVSTADFRYRFSKDSIVHIPTSTR